MKEEHFSKIPNFKSWLKDIPAILFTFILVLFAWIFFRVQTLSEAFYVIKKIALEFPLFKVDMFYPKRILIILALVVFEWLQRKKEHPLQIDNFPPWLRIMVYYGIIAVVLLYGFFNYNPFIYFRF